MTTRGDRAARRVLASALCVVLVGCTAGPPTPVGDDYAIPGVPSELQGPEVRTDPVPITREFPQLGDVLSVRWQAGTLGVSSDDRITVPGPTDSYVEAVVTLSPAALAQLVDGYEFLPATTGPRPPRALEPFVAGGGTWLSSVDLDAVIGRPAWFTDAYLRPESGVVYLSATTH